MNEKIDTEINRRDIIVSASKAVASFIPYVGPFMAEIIGVVIPNQRWDRISEYVRILNEKVVNLEEKINNQESVDLLEDSLLQSARALTRERKEYIASMLKNGLMKEEQTHAEKKKLLSILGELNDIEIIFLKYYSLNLGIGQKHPFVEQHINILIPPSRALNLNSDESNRSTFYDSYNWNLERNGLIVSNRQQIAIPRQREITPLGKLLLEYLDLIEA
jgi:hypothetical protein